MIPQTVPNKPINGAADATLAAGGRVVGVIPEALMQREVGHAGLSELHVVPTMGSTRSPRSHGGTP